MEIRADEGHDIVYSDVMLAKAIGDALEENYAGWGWAVNVNSEGGVVDVHCLLIEGELGRTYGFRIFLNEINHTVKSVRKKAIMAGGEILERSGVPRGPYRGQEIKFVEGVPFKHQPLKYQREVMNSEVDQISEDVQRAIANGEIVLSGG